MTVIRWLVERSDGELFAMACVAVAAFVIAASVIVVCFEAHRDVPDWREYDD